MRKAVILIFCGSLLLSCTSVNITYFDNEERTPTSNIDIYTHFSNIKREYKEIALITADDRGWGTSEADLIEHLEIKAMEIGADAIVLQPGEKQTDGYGFAWIEGNRITKAVAIIYVEE